MLFRKVIPALHCVPYFVPHLTACYSANGFRSIWSCPVDCPMGSRIGSCMDCYAMPWRPSSAMLGKDSILIDGNLDGNQTITIWTTCFHGPLPFFSSLVPHCYNQYCIRLWVRSQGKLLHKFKKG